MFHDTLPAQLDSSHGSDPWAPFRVNNEREVLALLRQVREATTTVHFASPGGVSASATLWTLDTEHQRLNFSAEALSPQLAAVVENDEATCVAYLDHVKLQFDVQDLLLVRGAKTCALQTSLPRDVFRFQRRQSFRVRPAGRTGPSVTLRHPALPDMLLKLRVLDISAGGCALLLPHNVPELRPGTMVHGAQVQLDMATSFNVNLALRHVGSMQAHEQGIRIGCEWHEPNSGAVRMMQQYVDQTQKRRRLLSLS